MQKSLFDERNLLEIRSDAYPGERLMVCRNPLLARQRAAKRQELLAKTEELLEPIAASTRRERRPYRGRDRIALRVGKVLNQYKMAKHFDLDISDESFAYRRNQESIAAEAALDGLYVVRTSLPAEEMDAEATVRAYKGLSVVEQAFRSYKTVDLKVRPIYHWTNDRVRAHVFLCLLAYYVEWHMRRRPAPLCGGAGEGVSGCPEESPVQAHARRPARAQLPHPAGGPGDHRSESGGAEAPRSPSLHDRDPAHAVTAAGAGSTWSSPIDGRTQ